MEDDGWPLPWPFPTSIPTTSVSSRGEHLAFSATDTSLAEGSPDIIENIEIEAEQFRKKFGSTLPSVKSIELYLIEGLSEITVPNKADNTLAVIYPPEFFYVLDVGLSCFIGGSVTWTPVGYGDPLFPEKRPILLRSVVGRTQANIIFPKYAEQNGVQRLIDFSPGWIAKRLL